MTIIDNGDGTWTDADTGNKYDQATGQPIAAVPDNTAFDWVNTPAITSGVVDTTGGQPTANSSPTVANQATGGAAPNSFLDGVNGILSTVENAFTNIAQPLIQSGIISTPASANQAQLAAAQAQQQLQAQTYLQAQAQAQAVKLNDSKNTQIFIIAAAVLLFLYLEKT